VPAFSDRSDAVLNTVDPTLQRLFRRVVKRYDCTVMPDGGKRTLERQRVLKFEGKSKTLNSKHLTGEAVDVMPYPLSWTDTKRNYAFCGYVRGVAEMMGIDVRGGHDWDRDWTFTDQAFHDVPHWELAPKLE